MKLKTLFALLALALVMCLAVPALASDGVEYKSPGPVEGSSLVSTLAPTLTSSDGVCLNTYGCKNIVMAAKDEAVAQIAGLNEQPSDLLLSAMSIVRDSAAKAGHQLTDAQILELVAEFQ